MSGRASKKRRVEEAEAEADIDLSPSADAEERSPPAPAKAPAPWTSGPFAQLGTDVRRSLAGMLGEAEMQRRWAPVSRAAEQDVDARTALCEKWADAKCLSREYARARRPNEFRSSIWPECERTCMRKEPCPRWAQRLTAALEQVSHATVSSDAAKFSATPRVKLQWPWARRGMCPTFRTDFDLDLYAMPPDRWPWLGGEAPADLRVELLGPDADSNQYLNETVLDPSGWLGEHSRLTYPLRWSSAQQRALERVLDLFGIDLSLLTRSQFLRAERLAYNVATGQDPGADLEVGLDIVSELFYDPKTGRYEQFLSEIVDNPTPEVTAVLSSPRRFQKSMRQAIVSLQRPRRRRTQPVRYE